MTGGGERTKEGPSGDPILPTQLTSEKNTEPGTRYKVGSKRLGKFVHENIVMSNLQSQKFCTKLMFDITWLVHHE